jgi:hypothetical protein
MNDQFKGVIQQANLEFGMKLNKISIYSMFPILLLLVMGYRLSVFTVMGLLMFAYIISVILLVFSKMKISIKFRNTYVQTDVLEAKKNIEYLLSYFKQDTFFNRLYKKNQARLVEKLTTAYDMIQKINYE